MTGATSGAGTAYSSRVHPCFQWDLCYSIFTFMSSHGRPLWVFFFILLSFSCWPMYCLSFDLLLLITPLVSSNSS